MTVEINTRSDITLESIRRVAWGGEPVNLSDEAIRRMREARARFLKLIEDPEVVVYGVTSGYGQNAKTRLTPEERRQHAARPPLPAAAAWGDPLPERVVR